MDLSIDIPKRMEKKKVFRGSRADRHSVSVCLSNVSNAIARFKAFSKTRPKKLTFEIRCPRLRQIPYPLAGHQDLPQYYVEVETIRGSTM